MNEKPNTRKENETVDRCQALMSNRIGVAPALIGFDIKSSQICQMVENIFAANGVDTSSDVFGVQAEWNSRFDECIRRPGRAPKNVPPFFVSVAVRRTLDDKTNQYSHKISKVLRELGAMMPNKGASAQALIMGDEALKKTVKFFNGDDKTEWRLIDQKRGVVVVKINPYKVIDLLLYNDEAPGRNYRYDIDIVSVFKNGSKNNRNPDNFSIRIIKQFKLAKYKDGKSMASLFRK